MLSYLIASCVVACIVGRLYVRLVRPRGLTWAAHPFISEPTFDAICTHYLLPGQYWALAWQHGYCDIGDPDPLPCCNIPWIWIHWLFYAIFTRVWLPLVCGSPPLRYAYCHEHIKWTSPWPNANNDPAYRVTHYTFKYTPFFASV
jgi:hypothetical protein